MDFASFITLVVVGLSGVKPLVLMGMSGEYSSRIEIIFMFCWMILSEVGR